MSPKIAICFEAFHRRSVIPLRDIGDTVPKRGFAAESPKERAVVFQCEDSRAKDRK